MKDSQAEIKSCCNYLSVYFENYGKWRTWLAIFFGQLLSLLLCLKAITTVYLVDYYNIHVPNAQAFTFYIILATVFTTILACRPGANNLFPILLTRGRKYFILALIDSTANYLVNKSYQLTTLTSVQLLDCFTIPTVLTLSFLILKIRYKVPHILGVSICLFGICCLVWADVEDGKALAPGKNRFQGDMLCLAGAFLFGISNISQELIVKTFDPVEFLGMVGLFGSFVSGGMTLIFEYNSIRNAEIFVKSKQFALFFSSAGAQAVFYFVSGYVVRWTGATMLNLSLLTADIYCVFVGIILFNIKIDWLYGMGWGMVMIGVLIFMIKKADIASGVYASLRREHTTLLDLEMETERESKDYLDSIQVGQEASLLVPKNINCDVVLQTTNCVN